jgi:hypothetical protein
MVQNHVSGFATNQATRLLFADSCDISRHAIPMTPTHQEKRRPGFRAFMLDHQYKVLAASVCLGLAWSGIYRLVPTSWILSRLILLIAIIS